MTTVLIVKDAPSATNVGIGQPAGAGGCKISTTGNTVGNVIIDVQITNLGLEGNSHEVLQCEDLSTLNFGIDGDFHDSVAVDSVTGCLLNL